MFAKQIQKNSLPVFTALSQADEVTGKNKDLLLPFLSKCPSDCVFGCLLVEQVIESGRVHLFR